MNEKKNFMWFYFVLPTIHNNIDCFLFDFLWLIEWEYFTTFVPTLIIVAPNKAIQTLLSWKEKKDKKIQTKEIFFSNPISQYSIFFFFLFFFFFLEIKILIILKFYLEFSFSFKKDKTLFFHLSWFSNSGQKIFVFSFFFVLYIFFFGIFSED